MFQLHLRFSFLFLIVSNLIFAIHEPLYAQKTYTDHKPSYRKWQEDYILDKIEYRKSSTVFFFRFVCRSGVYVSATFYPPGGEHPWYIKGRNIRKNFPLRAIKNVRRNGIMMKSNVVGSAYSVDAVRGSGYTVFSCEVHFDRLPNDLTSADLIEGKGQEYNRNHFNCFGIRLKTWKDDLGNEKDSYNKIKKFESKYNVNSKIKTPKIDEPDPPKPKRKKKVQFEEAETTRLDSIQNDTMLYVVRSTKKTTIKITTFGDQISKDSSFSYRSDTILRKKIPQNELAPSLTYITDINCEKKLVLNRVQFHDNSVTFKGMVEANRSLHILFQYLKDQPKSRIILYGHTDIFGSKERNIELSKARVIKIQRWLSMYGIHRDRIDLEWFGPAQPIFPEGDPRNRRVEFKIICPS